MGTRFRMPLRFRKEADANSAIEASGLFPIGGHAVPGELGRWYIVIDAPRNPAPIRAHLQCATPGITWTEEPLPEPGAS